MLSVCPGTNDAMRVGLLDEMETGNSRMSVTGEPAVAVAYGVAPTCCWGEASNPCQSMTPMHIRATPTTQSQGQGHGRQAKPSFESPCRPLWDLSLRPAPETPTSIDQPYTSRY